MKNLRLNPAQRMTCFVLFIGSCLMIGMATLAFAHRSYGADASATVGWWLFVFSGGLLVNDLVWGWNSESREDDD